MDITGKLPGLPSLGEIEQTVKDATTKAATNAAVGATVPSLAGVSLPGGWSATRFVMVILGLLLIAAGIFSFDKTRELVVSTAQNAGKAAKLAAVA